MGLGEVTTVKRFGGEVREGKEEESLGSGTHTWRAWGNP